MVNFKQALVRFYVPVLFFFTGISPFSYSQVNPTPQHVHTEQCGAVFLEEKQASQLGYFGSKTYFEGWFEDKRAQLRKQNSGRRILNEGIRQIPVVVHIIHQGEPIGEGANISEAQVLDQIRILNEDFQQRNENFSITPDEFLGVSASANIEFVLAKQRPDGLPTNGINRVQGPKNIYSSRDAALVADLVSWTPEEYVNIWVLPLASIELGYSSFPISDELEGLNNPPTSRNLDGVGIDTYHFGSIGNVEETSLGRTATHELGHFLGLRHIWGDGGCEVDDFVTDTPLQDSPNASCRINIPPRESCGSRDMVENYMDYTPDQCMSLFTAGQVERMNVILEFSPRRNSLLTSRALQEPEMQELDLALEKFLSPVGFNCDLEVHTQVRVINTGISDISEVRLAVVLNGETQFSQMFEVELVTEESAVLTFDPVMFEAGENVLEVEILEVNGTEDMNPFNNSLVTSPDFVQEDNLPYVYPGHDANMAWDIVNEDNAVTWQSISRLIDGEQEDLFYVNSFNYNGSGELDYLISPRFDLTDIPSPQLSFEMAYAPYNNPILQENLLVAISTDCGNTFDLLSAPYNKSEESLATQPVTQNEFFPNAQNQFRKEILNLSPYAGNPDVRIAFVSINGFGNNLFIKDIAIAEEEIFKYDFSLTGIENPLPVVSRLPQQERLSLTNEGNLDIQRFRIIRSSNVLLLDTLNIEEQLNAGESVNLTLPNDNALRYGLNRLNFILRDPNFDQNQPQADELDFYFQVDSSRIRSPWRADFDSNSNQMESWVGINPEENLPTWNFIGEINQESNLLRLTRMQAGNSYWLASPEFSLEGTSRASMFFNWAGIGFDPESNATFSVWASTNGGYSGVQLWESRGNELEKLTGPPGFFPDNKNQFEKTYINLNQFAGREGVRIYFKVDGVDDPESVLYLDDIEVFLSDNPNPVEPAIDELLVYPNPTAAIFNIAFNLEDYDDVRIRFYRTSGKLAYDVDFPNTLNQTYSFSKDLLGSGLFIVEISGNRIFTTKKLIIQ
ncbi:M43 family zinc metalloprotease [Cyclobacterium sp.]|uniref:M43 family zinc metalloprotease n=1 Tax=Cyclobacterium sp. TaxID=1966343 RepID=UPI0019964D85|nr:M43 family zinc metalloprotease [Cyclobacterium sp.]MBD3628642.1 T9SS type A sorting domain-containing protein [Cyclobacterium sp.]